MYQFGKHLRAVRAALLLINQGAELEQLIAWATRRRRSTGASHFYYIGRHYETQYGVIQHKSQLLRNRYPRYYWLARLLHAVSNLVSVKPAYFRSAAQRK